ncbi:lytic transglycosylase domain-containing protein [Gordonia sp. w5E2]|nr:MULTISPECIES: lytic transglycosylase domain-containing protein [Gordonia]
MRAPHPFRRRRGPKRTRLPGRALAVGAGGVLVGVMVLGAATSSAQGGVRVAVRAEPAKPTVLAAVAPAEPVALLGFAPPPTVSASAAAAAATATAPQYRLAADLPSGPLGIPGVVLQAYKLAANRIGTEEPQCKLPWFLLAGIGRIESNHASNGSVDQYGNTINPIEGPVLDGSLAGNEVIRHQGGYARAMGPMQFIPGTWAAWGADGNGDGKADPNNIFDSTYSAGRYLCSGFTDIMTDKNKVAAVYRYNHSMDYVTNVLAWAGAYATGVMPTNPIPEPKRPSSSSSSSSSKPSKPPKPGAPSAPGSSSDSSTPSTPTTPTQQCLGAICLPPGITIPGQPAPKPAPKQNAPRNPGPATTSTPALKVVPQ